MRHCPYSAVEDGKCHVVHSVVDGITPSLEHEHLRRKIENGIKEMWYYLRSQLHSLNGDSGSSELKAKVKNILEEGADHQR